MKTYLTFLVLVISSFARAEVSPTLKTGTALQGLGFCESELWEGNVYVGENFLQEEKSAVILSLTLKNPALRMSHAAVVEGSVVLNEASQAFELVLTHESNEIGRLVVKQSGENFALVGKVAVEEEITVHCK